MNFRLLKMIPLLMFSVMTAQEMSIDFQQIENLILEHNSELKALTIQIEKFEGELTQASLLINPELEFESVNGSDPETTVQISQTIEIGRKRHKRSRVEKLEQDSSKILFTNKKLEILRDARLAFLDILLAQQILRIKNETVTIAEDFLLSVQERVVAGSLSPAEEARAQISLTSLQVDFNRLRRNQKNNWRQLSSIWGSNTIDYSVAIGNLDFISQLPPEQLIRLEIKKSPAMLKKNIDIQIQQAIIESEQSNRIPDITFSAGVNKVEGANNTYQAGFSIPLKVFDRNQGTIKATNAQLDQLMEEKISLEIELESKLASIYSDLITIENEIDALKNTILPGAEKAHQIIGDGYIRGKFGFLDVIDAQTTLYEAEENYWLAITDLNKAIADIELLLGQSFRSLINLN